jgi:hypothetical protein
MATTFNPCCDLHFTCLDCPIITGPDCQPPNNLLPGQLWYNPCTCTYYFKCATGFDDSNTCQELTPMNYREGAGIVLAGDCDNGHYISIKITPDVGLGFTVDGELTVDCDDLISHCQLFTRNNLVPADGHFYLDCVLDEVGNEICTFYIDTIIEARDAGEVGSAGVCVEVTADTFVNGSAIVRSRDGTFSRGSGTFSAVGTYLTETFTNPWADAAYIEVDLICQDNFLASVLGEIRMNKGVTFIHSVTEELVVDPPNFGAFNNPVPPNWAYNQIYSDTGFFDPIPENPPNQGRYAPQTVSCKFSKLLAPGESLTLYYQYFAVFMDHFAEANLYYTLHGGTATSSKMIRHAAHF